MNNVLTKTCRFLCAVALVVTFVLSTSSARCQETPVKITDIIVLGNTNINRESIVAASGLKVGDVLTQQALDEAKNRLLLTQNFGARDVDDPTNGVRIRADVVGSEAKVVIEVDENDKVKGITIEGTGPVPASDVRALLQTKEGTVLNMGTLRTDTERIQRFYSDKGYQALINDVSFTDGNLHIVVTVAKVNKILIRGLKKTKEVVIRREMKTREGEFFNTNVFRKDIVRIFNTDIFEDVVPSVGTPSSTLGIVDLTLSVTEKRSGTVVLGVGYSSRENIFGHAEIGDTNFLGRGQTVDLRWETGGQANRNSIELGFTEPWLDRRHTSMSVSLYDKTVYRFGTDLYSTTNTTTNNNDYYYEIHTGGSLTLGRPFTETYRGYVGFRYDNVRVPTLNLNLADATVLQNGPLTVVTAGLTHNTRDLDTDPVSGGYEVYNLDLGHADLSPVRTTTGETATGVYGNVNYQKLQADVRKYFSPQGRRKNPKDKRNVFAIRLSGGSSSGTLPFSELYFMGGAETLRGYKDDRFWGTNMLLASVEFRTPLANSLTGVVFTDLGDAWGGPYGNVKLLGYDQHSGFSPSVGVGFGLRVVTPIGPIRIDEGFGSEGARTHFSIGHAF